MMPSHSGPGLWMLILTVCLSCASAVATELPAQPVEHATAEGTVLQATATSEDGLFEDASQTCVIETPCWHAPRHQGTIHLCGHTNYRYDVRRAKLQKFGRKIHGDTWYPTCRPYCPPYGVHPTCWRPFPDFGNPCPPVLPFPYSVGTSATEVIQSPVPAPALLPEPMPSDDPEPAPSPLNTPPDV